jgi:heme A synthase
MVRAALVFAFAAMLAAGLPSPGLYLAIGLGIAAIGTGYLAYSERNLPGGTRLAAAAAISVGTLGVVLGAVRVAMVLGAIEHIDRMLG